GIGTLLEDGIGDTVRVSLTEDPEFEIPVCRDLVKRYAINDQLSTVNGQIPSIEKTSYNPCMYQRRQSFAVSNIGDHHVPVVIADLSKL
ncbi:flavodoxin-dependent (E)-4-hydroxy-3-methylbut-2-enyl-diphosphate synthase, partial [Acinetobacter baumannii]